MVELSLLTLLNTVPADFCTHRSQGRDVIKAALIAYSNANDKYGGSSVRKVITESPGIEAAAIAVVVSKCPDKL